jgi:hypothetical protein
VQVEMKREERREKRKEKREGIPKCGGMTECGDGSSRAEYTNALSVQVVYHCLLI